MRSRGKARHSLESIVRTLFERWQDAQHGRNRRTGKPELPLAGGLFVCAHCDSVITGERILCRLAGGEIREHTYYRCPNNEPGPNHPRVRWQSDDNDHPGGRHEGRLRQYAPETDSAEPRRRRVAR